MTTKTLNDDLVAVMVPARLLPAVYGLLGSEMRGAMEVEGQKATTGVGPGKDFWSAALVKRAFEESPPAMKAFLKTLAHQPNKGLTIDDFSQPVTKAVGKQYGPKQLSGVLGAFGRRVRNRYAADEWPFLGRWNYDLGQVVYTMPADTAEIITSLEE